ncbi:MAG: acetolactate synthase, large subunit, biosynthetic type [Spirochaetaceae bacterium 4572_7]|nr:MAG: acetolactate synthase, large subunit, biosynthetic type [Spirochaetaceae bacterium 4572_7]
MSENLRTGAEALTETMVELGVECVFGLPGGAAIPIYDAIYDSSLELILTRHEQGATHMADGYARATGKTGVAIVTSGPGATNTMTGILTAMMDSVPIVVISGQQTTNNLGLDTFQEADVQGISFPIVKHSYLVTEINDLPRIVKEAFHLAETGRPGPVVIDIPKNVSGGFCELDEPQEFDLPGYKLKSTGDIEDIKKFAAVINSSERPILLIGHGAIISRAEKEIAYLAREFQIPVTNTLLGKGAFPETDPLSLGMPGMHGTAYANKSITTADLIISIGSRWDDRISGNPEEFCVNAKKIQIDVDKCEINKSIKLDAYVHGDARTVLEELLPLIKKVDRTPWIKKITKLKKDFPLTYKKVGKLRAQHVIDEMYDLAKKDAIYATDVGQHQMWAAQFIKTDSPRTWLSSGGAGTMGYGFPAAIGAQIGKPNSQVIAIVGDGGFQMTLCELSTAVTNKLPIKILVINNSYLGMVRQWQDLFYDNRLSGVKLVDNPDLLKLAGAYGLKGFRIKRSSDVRRVLKEALDYNDGPCIIDAEVEKCDNVFPMVPAGAPLEEMILDRPTSQMEKPKGST